MGLFGIRWPVYAGTAHGRIMMACSELREWTMASHATGLLTRNPWVVRRPLTVAEYHRMGEVGILTEDDRVELIEGELIAMSPIGTAHAGTVNAFNYRLIEAIGRRGVVAVQNPVQLDDL